jgi:hypothetical protein
MASSKREVYCICVNPMHGVNKDSIGYLQDGGVTFPSSRYSGDFTKTFIDTNPDNFKKIREVKMYVER